MLLEDCDVVARNPRVLYAPGTKTFTSSRGFFQKTAEKTSLEPFVGQTLVLKQANIQADCIKKLETALVFAGIMRVKRKRNPRGKEDFE
jgi:hypothetical protein